MLVACFQVVGAKRKPCCLANNDDVLWALFPSWEAYVVAPSFLPSADHRGENLAPATQAAEALPASQPSLEAWPLKILGGVASQDPWRLCLLKCCMWLSLPCHPVGGEISWVEPEHASYPSTLVFALQCGRFSG